VFPVVDLTWEEEDDVPDTSRDEQITHKFFGDLNRGPLGPPGDDNVIILSDFEEEEEVHKDDRADVEVAPSSAMNSQTPTAFAVADDDAPNEVQGDSSSGGTPDWMQNGSSDDGDEVGTT
jgi:hypothetical protein